MKAEARPASTFPMRALPMKLSPATLLFVPLLLASCGKQAPKERPTIAEQATEINAVFATPRPYATRTLDSTDILDFLVRHPAYRNDSAELRAFYQSRGHQYAWFVNDSLSSAAEAMVHLLDPVGGDEATATWRRLITLGRDGGTRQDSLRLAVELGLTATFFQAAAREYGGYVQGDLRELHWYIPRQQKDYTMLLDSLVAGRTDLSPIEPVHPQYQGLKYRLQRYYRAAADMQHNTFAFGGQALLPGDSLPGLCELRHHLFLLGDLEQDSVTDVMDSTLLHAIVDFQERHGLEGTGRLDAGLAAALNVPVAERIRTILLNMERLRWVNPTPPKNLLLVNIPEYRLHVFEEGKEPWSMKVVVGAAATHTVIFNGELSLIAFAPYWNIPGSIVRQEIVPAMRRDPGYLARQGMEVVKGGQVVPANSIDWSSYQGEGPFLVRQRPGPRNSLGQVKFLFPNEYSIYLHDTPAKERFKPEKRAFSHGCIRLSEPRRLAEYLLRNDSTWTAEAIGQAMQAQQERMVQVKPPVPVTMGYFTAWVDVQGRLNFRDDLYGHDARLAQELFAPGTMPTAQAGTERPEAVR